MRMQFKNKEWHLPLFIKNKSFLFKTVLALSVLLVGTVQAQSVEVRQSSWEVHPMYRADSNCDIENDTSTPSLCKRFNLWQKTLTIHYVPQLPEGEQGKPLGYIEKMYCAANPGYSCRCTDTCSSIRIPRDGPSWNLIVEFKGVNPDPSIGSLTGIENSELSDHTGYYQVNHSSGRLVSGKMDTISDLPYGVGTVRYYVTAYGKGGNGQFTVEAGEVAKTTHNLNLPGSPPH